MNTYRVIHKSDIEPTHSIHATDRFGVWFIENTQDGYYATSFLTKERAEAVCKEWNSEPDDPI